MAITLIQFRRDTTINWTNANPVIRSGEPVYDIDKKEWTIGDGVTAYNDLPKIPIDHSLLASSNIVSGSSQINHDLTTNFVANEHINHTQVSILGGAGLIGGGTIDTTKTLTLDTGSIHFTNGIQKNLPSNVAYTNTDNVFSTSQTINGNLNLTNNLIVTGSITATSLITSDIYKTVSSIPSYLKVDNISVFVSGDGYKILNTTNLTEVPLSMFGAKADLEYIDIEFTSGNQISSSLTPFTSEDIGKNIAIKDTHHNPNTADGNEFPDSQLGRIVTITAEILDVIGGVATIDFTCNLVAPARAYKYTNNFDALQQATNFCNAFNIGKICRNQKGVYGITPQNAKLYTNQIGVYIQQDVDLEIVDTGGNSIKLCVEDSTEAVIDFFRLERGNADFTTKGNILPPDRYSTQYAQMYSVVSTFDSSNQDASGSVRTITIEDISFTKDDLDGNDGWFCDIYTNTRGGLNNTDKKQKFYARNIDTRNLYGGYTCFSQNGNWNSLYFQNINIERFSSNYEGQSGRSWVDNSTLENMNDSPTDWRFNIPFVASGGFVTIDESSDFSFYDYQNSFTLNSGRIMRFSLSTNYGSFYNIFSNDVISSKVIKAAVPDGSYNIEWKVYHEDGGYGHPFYIHPNLSMYFEDVKQLHDLYWINSSGGVPFDDTNDIEFVRCSGTLTHGNTNYNPRLIFRDNSKINATGQYSEVILDNSYLSESNLDVNKFTPIGINFFNGCTIKIKEPQLDLYIDGRNFTLSNIIYFDSVISKSSLVIDNFNTKPLFNHYIDVFSAHDDTTVTLQNCLPQSAEAAFRFLTKNFKTYYVNNYHREGVNLYRFPTADYNENLIFINSRFSADGGTGNGSDYLTSNKPNKIGIDFIDENWDSFAYTGPGQSDLYLGGYAFTKYQLECNFIKGNKYILDPAEPALTTITGIIMPARRPEMSRSNTSMWNIYTGRIKVKVTSTHQLDVLKGLYQRNNTTLVRSATINNLIVKSNSRVVDEIVTFEIMENGFLKEVGTTIEKKYTDSLPTRKGIHNEELIVNNDYGYKYKIKIQELVDSTSTEVIVMDNGINNGGENLESMQSINTGKAFTIGQNFSDGIITPFSFSVVLSDDTILNFDNVNPSYRYWVPNAAAEFVRNWWAYVAYDGTYYYTAYVDNVSGKIFFLDYEVPAITLKATDNLILNGLEVVSEGWERFSLNEFEQVTTAERTAIASECPLGYKVYDTDLDAFYFKGSAGWVAN